MYLDGGLRESRGRPMGMSVEGRRPRARAGTESGRLDRRRRRRHGDSASARARIVMAQAAAVRLTRHAGRSTSVWY